MHPSGAYLRRKISTALSIQVPVPHVFCEAARPGDAPVKVRARHGRSPSNGGPDWHSGSNVTFAYLQKILVDGEAIGAVRQAVFGQIIFEIVAGRWPADG